MEQIREVTTLETPINPNLSRELQLLAATPRWQRPDSATISALLNGAVAHKDVELLADAVQVLADKWDGAVDFWEFDMKSYKDRCIQLQQRLNISRVEVREEKALVARLTAENEALRRLVPARPRRRVAPRDLAAPRADGRPRRRCTVGRTYRV